MSARSGLSALALPYSPASAAPKISLRVNSMDGSAMDVTAAQRGLVREVKHTLAQSCEMDPGLIELFVEGTEDALLDAARLDSVGVGNSTVLFMLPRQGTVACRI